VRRKAREAGFTLLELLVALALLALLALGAFHLLQLPGLVQAAAPAHTALADRLEARLFLAFRLARALPLPAGEQTAFAGDPHRLRFVFAPLPEDPTGGPRAAELTLQPDKDGVVLLWREAPAAPGEDPFAALDGAIARPLARMPNGSTLAYLLPGEEGGEPRRRARVGPGDPLPLVVRLGPPVPYDPTELLLLPLQIRVLSDCAAGRAPCG